MHLDGIDDWEERRRRWDAFWGREKLERPIMLLTAPAEHPPSVPEEWRETGDYEYHWTDIDHQVAWLDARTRARTYHGEAIPAAGGPLAAWCGYYGYEGYGNWWPIWCRERLLVFQSDLSCMVSPEMFERFIVPHLEITAEHVVHAFYHLDGPDAIRHVERVCRIPQVRAIQWVPGAGTEPGALQWLDLSKRIQAAGCAVFAGAGVDEVEPLIRELDPSNLILGTQVESPSAADRLLDDVTRWTAKYA